MTTEHTFLIVDNQFITQVGLRWLIRQTYTDALIHEVADKRALLATALSGKPFHCHAIESLLSSCPQPKEEVALTPTEREVLRLIASGKTVKEIAALRNSSVHTIITHKKNLFRKLEVNNVYEATKYALKAGLIELVEYYI